MGRRGPLPRRDEQDSPTTALERRPPTPPGVPQEVPPAPPGLLAETRSSWTAFWTSAAANWVDRAAHMQRLVRWIRDVDEWNRIHRDLRPRTGKPALLSQIDHRQHVPGIIDPTRPWLAQGSTGQITRHPNTEEIDKLDARIHRAEVEFGMTPYAGVRLGLAGVQGALTAEQLSKLIHERSRRDADPAGEDWAEGFAPG